jgi:hypothetical protein
MDDPPFTYGPGNEIVFESILQPFPRTLEFDHFPNGQG